MLRIAIYSVILIAFSSLIIVLNNPDFMLIGTIVFLLTLEMLGNDSELSTRQKAKEGLAKLIDIVDNKNKQMLYICNFF